MMVNYDQVTFSLDSHYTIQYCTILYCAVQMRHCSPVAKNKKYKYMKGKGRYFTKYLVIVKRQ